MTDKPFIRKKGPTRTWIYPGDSVNQVLEELRDMFPAVEKFTGEDLSKLRPDQQYARAETFEFIRLCCLIAKPIFDAERVPMEREQIERIIKDGSAGNFERITEHLYFAASVAFGIQYAMHELTDGDKYGVARAFMGLAKDYDNLIAYREWENRSPQVVANPARTRKKEQRIDALQRAVDQGEVSLTPAEVCTWRGEERTRANRTKAGRDIAALRERKVSKRGKAGR